jgi:hypothetical protein
MQLRFADPSFAGFLYELFHKALTAQHNRTIDLCARRVEIKINTGSPPAIDKDSILKLKI